MRDKRDWVDRLQSRIDQEQTVIDGLREAVSSTEEAILPLLRDALISASDAQSTPIETKAKPLTDRLLMEMRASGCQKTTRISQAIQTLQQLLWSLRTGQLKDKDIYPDWELRSMNFDEDWKWLGSYATWRAAMFVYLYPENILYPTLRKWQSSGFKEFNQKLRLGRRLNPEVACELAKEFAQYYYDITHLEIQVSCQTSNYAYWYGRAPSGACYWSRYKKSDSGNNTQMSCQSDFDDFRQTSWKKIQCLSVKVETIKLFAAVPSEASSVLVFAKQKRGSQYQLVIAQHNLNDGSWKSEEEADELDLPKETRDFEAVVSQIRKSDERPVVVIQTKGELYAQKLNASGDGWENDWENLYEQKFGENKFLEDERTDSRTPPNIELKALVPIYQKEKHVCFYVLFYYGYKDKVLRYTILKFISTLFKPEPLEISTPKVRIRDHEWRFEDSNYEICEDLQRDKPVYLDRDYVWSVVAPELKGLTYIQTKNFHKYSTSYERKPDTYQLSFTVNQPVTVYVVHDSFRDNRAKKPFWLDTWNETSYLIQVSDPDESSRVVYSKDFDAGEITLWGNHGTPANWRDENKSMYNVILRPLPQDECNNDSGIDSGVGRAFELAKGNGWGGGLG